MPFSLAALWRPLVTSYSPLPTLRNFLTRAQTQEDAHARVTVAVLDAAESGRLFGVPLARRGIQPVYLRVENRGKVMLRFLPVRMDPNYYSPLEAAGVVHFSFIRRLSAYGLFGLVFVSLFPLLVLLPLKLITAFRCNRRMDEFFRGQAFHLRPIQPGGAAEGFVFTPLDSGTKIVRVSLHTAGDSLKEIEAGAVTGTQLKQLDAAIEFTFSIFVPGLAADYRKHDFAALEPPDTWVECDVRTLIQRLGALPPTTTNKKSTRAGDPANLVVVGEFETILGAFAPRWDESETITLATCWKTLRSFVFGSQYRYSPVSALYLFGRCQDVALQRTRRSINERLHLRLWLTPLRFQDKPVWFGQVSRDIGVRFTHKTWNLTTHRVDPDVDEARDYVLEDLLEAERVDAAAYVDGVGACGSASPRRNLTGDPYFSDGKRVAILLSGTRSTPRFVAWT